MVSESAYFQRTDTNVVHCVNDVIRTIAALFLFASGCFAVAKGNALHVSIDDAVEYALTNEPEIHSLGLQVEAQANLQEAATRLPDPTVRTGILNVPIDSFALNSEPMTQTLVGVRQTIPAIGSRIALSMKHGHLSEAFAHRRTLQRKTTTLATRIAWLEAHYQRHAVGLTTQALQLLESFVNVVRARYAAGDELQLAVLAAELELNRLQSRLIDTNRQREQSVYELQRLIGVADELSVGIELPNWNVAPTRELVTQSIKAHPRIQAANALIAAESAMTQLQETALKPEWHLDLSYGIRDGTNLDGSSRSDFASATLSFSLPIVEKRKHNLRLLSAQASVDSARSSKTVVLRDMLSEIDVSYSEWARLTERLTLLDETIIAQSHNHAQAALKAYQNKEGSFTDVLLSYVNEVDLKLEQHRVKIDRLKVWATIDSLNGSSK